MKKIKYLLITLLLTIPITGKAAVIHCSAPSSVESGETFTVTFSGSLNSSASVWFASIGSSSNVTYAGGDGLSIPGKDGASMSHSVRFTAGNPGTASFYAYDVDVSDGINSYSDSDTCYTEIVTATRPNGGDNTSYNNNDDDVEIDPDKSSNSYLKTLSIDGVKINPKFDKDKMNYTAVVSGDKDKINVTGELEDDKASVTGFGEKELIEGINKIEVMITAENGEIRTYTILVTKKEKDPIEVTINKKKYTVSKKDIGLKVPDGFAKTTVVIDKQEVVAYSNSFTGYILVALVDEDGNASWYIYNSKNSTYIKYSEFESDNVRLIILEPNKKDIPHRYKKCTFELNGEKINGYALEYNSSFRLVYALNMKTGEKEFYLYDMDENTFQRFYNRQVGIYRDLLKKLEIGIIGLISIIGIMFIIIISQIVVNKKTKKFIKSGGNEDKDDLNNLIKEEEKHDKEEEKSEIEEKISKTIAKEKIEKINEDKTLSKKEMKQRIKEEKNKLKKERKDFLR